MFYQEDGLSPLTMSQHHMETSKFRQMYESDGEQSTLTINPVYGKTHDEILI